MSPLTQGLVTDYINHLAKEHPTAARLVQHHANQELKKAAESTQPVPDADPED